MGEEEKYRTCLERLLKLEGMTVENRKELRRSRVRILVTYFAAVYLFWIGPILCYCLFFHAVDDNGVAVPGIEDAKNLYMSILPISSGILAYWFGTRSNATRAIDKGMN